MRDVNLGSPLWYGNGSVLSGAIATTDVMVGFARACLTSSAPSVSAEPTMMIFMSKDGVC